MHFYMFDMLHWKHHNAMWCNGCKFCIKKLDEKKKTSNSGITIVLQVNNVSSRSDRHPEVSKNKYYGYLDDMLEWYFGSFKLVMFEVKWYRLQMNERDPERTIIKHANGSTMVKTKTFETGTEICVLPSQCE